MSNYTESKQKLDAIRSKYMCAGDIIFRTAIQYVVDYGKNTLLDKNWYDNAMNEIDAKHDAAEAEGKILWVTRNFEKAIIDCAVAVCDINTYDLLIYIQREVFLSSNGIDYQRMVALLEKCIEWVDETHASVGEAYDTLQYIGFSDSDIEILGFEYILDVVYPDEEEE